jgi:tRNA G18 (ribose-2'-O)-methylase SpoU
MTENGDRGLLPAALESQAMHAPFQHIRHKPPDVPATPRELVVACAPLRSHVNLSHIVRTCGCFGIRRVIACGAAGLHGRIARDGADSVELSIHRTLPPVLDRLRDEGFQLVGLEQATGSERLFTFSFMPRTVLVIGNERTGLEPDVLAKLDRVAEIPMAGLPHSLNAATSASIAIYEYCRQRSAPPAGGAADGRAP